MLFFSVISILVISSLLSLIAGRNSVFARYVSGGGAIVASVCALIFAISAFNTTPSLMTIPTLFPLFHVSLYVDKLSAFFIGLISLIAIPASLYGMSYLKNYTKYNIGAFGFFYDLFLLSLFLVVTAYNGLYFLFVWEIMSLASLFLVFFEYEKNEVVRAGSLYFIMTHAAAACLLIAFIMLYIITGSFDFGVIKAYSHHIPMIPMVIVSLLMLIGFGTKAGIIPLHIWLPKAHGAAPSHVSALMSGIMIKMGIFMMIRMFIDILMPPQLWLGTLILIIGGISSLLGVLYALSEHNSKRLLAYHSIENIGIILLGVGGAIIFLSLHQYGLAALALVAGLFHTVNHAVFKSLLFLCAGAVITKTHTLNMEEYGGLIKRMPYTALFFLIGAIAIAGLPPFNGFVSEWLTFQSLFQGIMTHTGVMSKGLFIFGVTMLAFTGGLAAACFVKAFGVIFLARPRSEESRHATEVDAVSVVSMGFLAALCVLISIFSGFMVTILLRVVSSLGVATNMSVVSVSHESLLVNNSFGSITMPIVMTVLLIGYIATVIIVYLTSHQQKSIRQMIWDCGYTELTPRMEITATAFSRSLMVIFKGIFSPSKQVSVEYVDANMRYFSVSSTVTLHVVNFYEKNIYYPIHNGLLSVSRMTKRIQGGNLDGYLLYIFVTLIGLLIFARYMH